MVQAIFTDEGRLTVDQIAYIINNTATEREKFTTNNQYYAGNNTTILEKDDPSNDELPNNKIPIPYGKKLADTTKNYIFTKDVVYNANDNAYMGELHKIFDKNENQDKLENIGEDLIIFGVAYKLFYFSNTDGKYPRYAVIDGGEVIPVYNYDIEPKLSACIRYFLIEDMIDSANNKTMIELYYSDNLVKYEVNGETIEKNALNFIEDKPHGFNVVPMVVYGDEYQLGVFEPYIEMIDAIDNIVSQNMNEIDKFALAYLVLTGQKFDPEDTDDIVEKRIIEIEEGSKLEYLIKTIDGEFRGNVLAFLVDHIHKISGIPDFASKDFAAESGIALLYKLMGFENLAASIEKIFKKGEQNSIFIINSVLYNAKDKQEFLELNPEKNVEIKMFRNIPENVKAELEEAKLMKEIGISDETIYDMMSFIKDTAEELKRSVKQSEDNFNRFRKMQEARVSENEDQDNDQNVNEE